MKRQISILVCSLGGGKVLSQKSGNDANGRIVAAGNVQGKAAARIVLRPVDHGKGALRRISKKELDGIHGIEFSRNMNRQAALVVDLVDTLLVCSVDDLESRKVIMRRSVMDGHRTHSVLMNQGLGIQNQNHVNEQSPSVAVSCDDVQRKLAGILVDLLRKVGVLIQHRLDHGPILLLNVAEQLGLADINDFSAGNRSARRFGFLRRGLSLRRHCAGSMRLRRLNSSLDITSRAALSGLLGSGPLRGGLLGSGPLGGGLLHPHGLNLVLGKHTTRLGLDNHRSGLHVEVMFSAQLSPHIGLDELSSAKENARAKRLDAVEGFSSEEDLGPAELKTGHCTS
mmetsp:Transcript_12675/g.30128  ORF Transcript_12675/g.30128 Transcript_12675/m.30128 type:complete len:340 (-) Transcript_12675:1636-2655(-)